MVGGKMTIFGILMIWKLLEVNETVPFGKAAIEKKALSSNLTEEARLNVAARNSSPWLIGI